MAARELHRGGLPLVAASAVNALQPVALAASANSWAALPCATSAVEPIGVALATAAAPGDALTVMDRGNIVKVVAGASLGARADIAVGSSNGALAAASAPVGSSVWVVGVSMSPAAAGEVFSLYVQPRQVA